MVYSMNNNECFDFYTTNSSRDKLNYPLKRKFAFGIILIIVPILGLVFTWIGFRLSDQGRQETLEKARVITDQIILTRQWITDCMGGVFVNTKSPGAQGVIFAVKDQIRSGPDTFQVFTPSMVTQKLSQYSFKKKDYQFRLSSLTPLNSANAPNDFEKTALSSFQKDKKAEYYQFGENKFEYMVPLYSSKGCIKCHNQEKAHTQAGIIGGLRVTIPYDKIKQSVKKNIILLGMSGLCITLATVLVLVFLIHALVLKPINNLEEKSYQLTCGDLSARVDLNTNDELERLGSSFNIMAESLMHNQDEMEEKISKATKDLASANQELLKLDRLKSDFIANMSHELRTPLTAVKGSINYLERTISEKQQKEFVQIIDKNISRVTRLISNLFDFTRLEAGTMEWEFQRHDICLLLTDVVDIMTPIALKKNIRMTYNCQDNSFAVIDSLRMEQVLVNLLDNAIKFSDTGAEIKIDLTESANRLIIAIQDQGPGIAKEDIETIFEKFYSSSNKSGRRQHGAGMGLALSRAIVTAHKGTLEVVSPGAEHSIFYLKLPKE